MSDHNFEKQVQQRLDELKIPPSANVWVSVEAQIRKDKRRRRGVVFFPALLLLTGAGCYFIFQNYLSSTNNSVSKSASATIARNDKKGSNTTEDARTERELGQQKATGKGLVNTISQPDIKKVRGVQGVDEKQAGNRAVPVDRNQVVDDNILSTGPRTPSQHGASGKEMMVVKNKNGRNYQNNKPTVENKRPQKVVGDNEPVNRNSSGQNSGLPVLLKPVQEELSKNKQTNPATEPQVTNVDDAVGKSDSDSAAKQVVPMQSASVDSAATLTKAENSKAVDAKIKTSLKWGLTGSVGMSNLNEGGFFASILEGITGAEKAHVADVAPNPVNNTQSIAGPSAVVYTPSEIEKGFSFSFGAFIQKSITRKFSISTGLQYRYYSNHIQVGNRIDSFAMVQNAFGSMNISQYYRAGPVATTHRYTNRFHFVELPVSGHLQLNKGNRVPISWNAGLSLSYLVSANVLHFDSRTGLYYKDNDLLNRLQVGMSTGFAVTLLNASRLSVQLGPELQYNFTDLMKQKVSDDKHLFYFGLNSKVFLKK